MVEVAQRSLVLVGMPGSGKSRVGRCLAAALGWAFQDLDQQIEAASGLSIVSLFDLYGEDEFRALERRVLHRILAETPCVLSTGGGTLVDATNRAAIKERGFSIWLKAEPALLVERILRRTSRPLFSGSRAAQEQKLLALLAQRTPYYAAADLVVAVDDRPADKTMLIVLGALKQAGIVHMTGDAS